MLRNLFSWDNSVLKYANRHSKPHPLLAGFSVDTIALVVWHVLQNPWENVSQISDDPPEAANVRLNVSSLKLQRNRARQLYLHSLSVMTG